MNYLGATLCDLDLDKGLYETVCTTGVAALTAAERRILKSRLDAYYNSVPDVHLLPVLQETMLAKYAPLMRVKRRKVVAALRKRLLEGARGSCPYCGELAVPTALDHFLPEERFPDFAVLSANLIPICSACNSAKGTSVKDDSGARIFFHAYFDPLLSKRLVKATVRWFQDIPRFSVSPITALSHADKSRVARHLRQCNLQERFSIAASNLYLSWRRRQNAAVFSPAQLRVQFLNEIERHDGHYGKNNWASITYRALLRSSHAWLLLTP